MQRRMPLLAKLLQRRPCEEFAGWHTECDASVLRRGGTSRCNSEPLYGTKGLGSFGPQRNAIPMRAGVSCALHGEHVTATPPNRLWLPRHQVNWQGHFKPNNQAVMGWVSRGKNAQNARMFGCFSSNSRWKTGFRGQSLIPVDTVA